MTRFTHRAFTTAVVFTVATSLSACAPSPDVQSPIRDT